VPHFNNFHSVPLCFVLRNAGVLPEAPKKLRW
jgi:hypothetical protein